MYDVWEPGFPVKLGDYGVMTGNIFTQWGNISELTELKNFKIKYRTDNTKDEKFLTSSYSISFQVDAKVPVIDLANGSLCLTLKSQKSSDYKVVTEEGIIPLTR